MKGILFRPWKIKAIATNPDKEWQTRRGIKPQPPFYCDSVELLKTGVWNFYKKDDPDFHAYLKAKPRYHVGETVYLKQPHYAYGHWEYVFTDEADGRWEFYQCDDFGIWFEDNKPQDLIIKKGHTSDLGWYKRSPLFLKTIFARYFAKILKVGACRTKDITPEDCFAEGISPTFIEDGYSWPDADRIYPTAQRAYAALYDSINGEGAHEKNWDFKYTFKLEPMSKVRRE